MNKITEDEKVFINAKYDLIIGIISGFCFRGCTIFGEGISEFIKSLGVNEDIVVLIKIGLPIVLVFILIFIIKNLKFKK